MKDYGVSAYEFCVWLQGYFDLEGAEGVAPDSTFLSCDQCVLVKRQLARVFATGVDDDEATD